MMSTALASMRLLVATLILLVSLEAMAQTPQRVAAPAQPLLKAADKARAPIIGLTMIMLTRHGADMPVFDAPLLSAVAASSSPAAPSI